MTSQSNHLSVTSTITIKQEIPENATGRASNFTRKIKNENANRHETKVEIVNKTVCIKKETKTQTAKSGEKHEAKTPCACPECRGKEFIKGDPYEEEKALKLKAANANIKAETLPENPEIVNSTPTEASGLSSQPSRPIRAAASVARNKFAQQFLQQSQNEDVASDNASEYETDDSETEESSEDDTVLSQSEYLAPQVSNCMPIHHKTNADKSETCKKEKRSNANKTCASEHRFQCKECEKCFKKKYHLIRHLRTHSDERPFVCNQCGKSFKLKGNLTAHMFVHKEERPFVCNQCGKRFKLMHILTSHLRVHKRERPFACSRCGKSFKRKSTLTAHMISHNKKRSFICGECEMSFKIKFSLIRHMFLHKEERPFLCTQCSKSYTRKDHLTKHMNTHTSD